MTKKIQTYRESRLPEKIIFSTKSIERMEQIFENKELNVSVRILKNNKEVLFYAKDAAVALGYENTRKAIKDHVWNRNKGSLKDFAKGNDSLPIRRYHPDTVLLREAGLYQLIFSCRLPIAETFQQWVFEDVLPSIRKTGTYTVPIPRPLEGERICLLNENDLHFKVIEYIRKYHPDTLIIAGLGEFQRTPELRIEGWKKGYTAGQPDIIIADPSNGYTGLAIELKTPRGTGVVSCKQVSVLNRMEKRGYKTLVSNNFIDIILEIHKYFQKDPTVEVRKENRKLKRECNDLDRKLTLITYNSRPIYHGGKY
jgi:prophage antirepressor-like protein